MNCHLLIKIIRIIWSEWINVDKCKMSNFFSYIMASTRYISMSWWRWLCTRPTCLVGFLIVLIHWNNILQVDLSPIILISCQPVFVFTPWCCMPSREEANNNFTVFPCPVCGSNPRSTIFEAITLIITPLMQYSPALDNYGQSCFVRSDFKKMKCVYKTQMMPPPDHKKL